jgi:hypothetical protein
VCRCLWSNLCHILLGISPRVVLQRRETKADTLKQLRPIGEGDQELEKRLDQEELT